MQFGYYTDNNIPRLKYKDEFVRYKTNSSGYRCPEWSPLPEGKKNVVILGCSHTYGVGLEEKQVWVDQLYNLVDRTRLRFWNLGSPGASGDHVVRVLYSTEKVLFPKIIIVCWPLWNRRERIEKNPINLTSNNEFLKLENDLTDKSNFFKNLFFVEKFAEKVGAKTFHCFADKDKDKINLTNINVYHKESLKSCWPEWSKIRTEKEKRVVTQTASVAKDGFHYGIEHHTAFAQQLYNEFKLKLK